MSFKKKLLAAGLCSVMVVGTVGLVGCNSKEPQSEAENTGLATTVANKAAEVVSESANNIHNMTIDELREDMQQFATEHEAAENMEETDSQSDAAALSRESSVENVEAEGVDANR